MNEKHTGIPFSKLTDVEIFDTFAPLVLGTDMGLIEAIALSPYARRQVSPSRIELVLERMDIVLCAGCGTWSYCSDEYCDECIEYA